MPKLTQRKAKAKPSPLSEQATGEWFRTPAGVLQRYDEAPGRPGTHWYGDFTKSGSGTWHAFHVSSVKTTRASRKRQRTEVRRKEEQ